LRVRHQDGAAGIALVAARRIIKFQYKKFGPKIFKQ
jgi:hypothetical protein